MPIGRFENFAKLKAHLRGRYAGVGGDRLNAITASVAEKMQPGWRKEAAAQAARTRKEKAHGR